MLRMTKRKSRILAGLMAFVLVFSNIAANVQTVYATGIATPSNGTMLPSPVQNDDDTAEQAPAQETTAPAETEAAGTEPEEPVTADDEYALVLDILPKAETDAETGRAVWNGGWDAYDYSELGQTLLQDSEYSALAGELTGSWSSDDTDVLAMRANGDARVKAPGYATVTFTYEAPEAEPEVIADEAAADEAAVDEAVIDEAAADEDTDEADGTAAEEQPEAEDEADAGSDEEPVNEATPQNADKPEEVSTDDEEEAAPSETPANEENAPEPEAEEELQEENEPAAAEDTEDEYPMADGTELSWAVKVESIRVTVYSDEPYNDVMQLAVEAGDEIADFGESHLEAMQEEPPYGVNVTLPAGGAWKSLDEDVVYLTLDGGMTVNVDDGACQIAYSYTVDGELYVALWDVTIGVGAEKMVFPSDNRLKGRVRGSENSILDSRKLYLESSKTSKLVYCVEEGEQFYHNEGSGLDDFGVYEEKGNSYGSTERTNYMNLIMYYANGDNSDNYNAVQAYLWDYLQGWVSWKGWLSDGAKKIYENINTHVDSFKTQPSFFGGVIERTESKVTYAGTTKTWPTNGELEIDLNDTNNVLANNYSISTSGEVNAWIEGNILKITPKSGQLPKNNATVTLTRKYKAKHFTLYQGTYLDRYWKNGKKQEDEAGHAQDVIQEGGEFEIAVEATITVEAPKRAKLTVTKTVKDGTGTADTTKKFRFHVNIGGDPYSFELADGESWPSPEYDIGTSYTITEESYGGYTASGFVNNGTIQIGGSAVTVTNTYNVKPTSTSFKVKKEVLYDTCYKWPVERTFTFLLSLKKGSESGVTYPANTTVRTNGTGEAFFNEIKFTEAGEYSFEIREQDENPTYQYYTYDGSKWTVDVTIGDDGEGNLYIVGNKVTYSKDGATSDAATFTNRYQPVPVTYTPEVSKKVTVDHERPLDKNFTFTLTEEQTDNPRALESDMTATVNVPKGQDGGPFTDHFDAISFDKPGTYNFTITEDSGGETGYTYDQNSYKLIVVVEENSSEGKLEIKNVTTKDSSDKQVDSIEFTNTYKPLPTHVELKVKKLIDAAAEQGGYTYPEDTIFRFILEQDLEILLNGFSLGRVVENQTVTLETSDTKPGVEAGTTEGSVSFAPLQYEKAGTYKYRIREEKGDTAGFTYDSTIWLVTVEVTDNDGQLEPKVTYTHGDTGNSDAAEFTNTYDTEATAYTPQVTKAILGSTTALDKNFTFNLKDITAADSQWSDSVTMTLKAGETAGSANFKTIIYVKPGTYKYQITEVKPENAETTYKGYSFDDAIWTLTVKVKDTGNALIVDSAEYEAVGKTTNGLSAEFANEYHVTETKLNAGIKKTVEGDDRPAGQEYKFLFDITQADDQKGATLPDETEITVVIRSDEGSENSGRFGDITFTAAGTYTFEIAEQDNRIPGYTYDTEPYVMTVEVVDNDSQLEVTDVSFTKGGQEVTVEPMTNEIDNTKQFETVFTNVYTVVPVEYAPKVTKEVTGEIRPEHKYFHFTLEASEDYGDSLTMPEKTTAEVLGTANGSVTTDSFGEITFNKAGTYEFRIEETNDSLPGYTYDKNVWTLTLVVADHASELKVDSITYATKDTVTNEDITLVGETAAAEFVNDYQVKPTVYGPEVVKTITGMPLWDETFEFELTASADNKEGGTEFSGAESARKVTVTGAGTAKFDDITFKKAGTYTFTVKETAGNSPYWTYDDRTWTLTVVVEDEDSQLVVKSHSYTSNRPTPDTSETAAEFENGFTAPGELRISKTVTGNAGEVRRDFHFTVTLTDLSGNPLKGSYSYTGSSIYGSEDAPADGVITDGVVTVTLRHGQEITFHDIPAGAGYRVEEAEADTEGYRTTLTLDGNGQAAAVAEGTIPIEGTSVVEYENYRYQPTGGTTPDRPGTNIPDNEVPQSPGTPDIITISDEPTPLSNFETIEDEDVPLAFLAPMTGDNKPVGAAALFGLLALGMMGAFGILASKKDEEDA